MLTRIALVHGGLAYARFPGAPSGGTTNSLYELGAYFFSNVIIPCKEIDTLSKHSRCHGDSITRGAGQSSRALCRRRKKELDRKSRATKDPAKLFKTTPRPGHRARKLPGEVRRSRLERASSFRGPAHARLPGCSGCSGCSSARPQTPDLQVGLRSAPRLLPETLTPSARSRLTLRAPAAPQHAGKALE